MKRNTTTLCVFLMLTVFALGSMLSVDKALCQTKWTRHENNPVLNAGSRGSWDDAAVRDPAVIFDGTTYHCWYDGQRNTAGWDLGIGYASSPDGKVWTKHPNQILDVGPSGSFDDSGVLSPCVLKVGDIFKMWYQGWAGGTYENRIGYATSPDGINWTKHPGNPVLDHGKSGTWNETGVFFPTVIFDGATYHMWYQGKGGPRFRIGYATSSDGIAWNEHPANPVLDVGSWGSWETDVAKPAVVFDGTAFHMWYTGGAPDYTERIGYATSPNGINWTKANEVNPVLDLVPGTWEQDGIEGACVLFDRTVYKMWYAGCMNEEGLVTWSIGYATSEPATSVAAHEETTRSGVPSQLELDQNHPNPFNPSTEIRFALPTANRVVLRIFNTVGQEIRTLADGRYGPGYHRVRWDGRDDNGQRMPSGVYLYRIEGQGLVMTKKMVLLQ